MTPQEIAEELRKTIKEFQDANDKRFKAVEAGVSTAVSSDKVEGLNAKITELRTAQDQMIKDVARLQVGLAEEDSDKDKEAVSLAARRFFAGRRGVDIDTVNPEEVKQYKAYRNAWPQFLRRGAEAMNDPDIRAAMQVGSDPDGGYWVPTQRMTEVIKRIFDTSEIRPLCDVITITGDSVTWPNDTNDLTEGGFIGETQARPETDTPKVGETTIYVREQYAMPKATQKLLDMSSIDVEGWLGGKIADKLARVENNRFVVGTGVKAPRGFMDYAAAALTTDDASRAWGKLQYVPVGAAGAFPTLSGASYAHDPDALITIVAKLKPAYRPGAVWTMNRATEAVVRKLKDKDGKYFIDSGDPRSAFTGFSIGGFPIRTLEDMAAVASNSYSIAFGNFKAGYQIVDGRGIRVLRDNLTQKGFVLFYATKWTGGDVLNFDAIKLMKFAAS